MSVARSIECVVPRTIGPYEILDEIGRGGMGVVYRAARLDDGSLAAVKIASEEMADQFSFLRREIQTLRRLEHPGVVRILAEGTEKGVPWYAMELLDSRSLDQLLGLTAFDTAKTESVRPFIPVSGVLPVSLQSRVVVRTDLPRVLTLMYRLARVLAHIHAHGVIHRDIKPQNVLVRSGDRPVLVDFGLMGRFRAHSGREVLEIAGLMLGTALYASPEQASGELVDARADLYSFGAMLYEVVTGAPPFTGETVHDVLLQHLSRVPARPSLLVHGVPPALDDLIMRLLEKRRGDRLGYAEDAAALLVEAGAEPDPDFETETAAYLYRPEIVGRRETMEALRPRIPEVRNGRGGFVVIGGESGIGKTSVAAAFAREATMGYLSVIAGECIPVATSGEVIGGQALHPLRPLFRQIADFCRAGGKDAIERILGPRLAVLRDQEPSLEALAELREGTPRIPAEIAARRLFTDVSETLAAYAKETPLLLVIDDLQWADEVTLRFLSSLDANFFASTPLMILGTYRADEVGPDLRQLLDRPHIVKMPLRRLDADNVHDIVRSMLAAPDAPADFLQFLSQQSEGNPFFVAEYLRAAVAEKLLFRESGRWRVRKEARASYDALGLPGTLRDLVAKRFESLSPVASRVLEAAAVLGREVQESLLIATSADREDDAHAAITELLAQHVFDPTDEGVRFTHDKLREGAYARIAPERRTVLHMRAAQAIEAAYPTGETRRAHAAPLAHHWDNAGDPSSAIYYYVIAAQGALDTGACREAKDLITRALVLDEQRVETRSRSSLSGMRRVMVDRAIRHAQWERLFATACLGLGDLVNAVAHSRKSLELLGVEIPQGGSKLRSRLLREMARQITHLVLPRRMYRARASKEAVLVEVAYSARKLAECCYYTADRSAMFTAAITAVNTADRLREAPLIVHVVYRTLGLFSGVAGLPRMADRYFAESRRLATAANDIAGLATLDYASLLHYVGICDWERAAVVAKEARTLGWACGDPQVIEHVEADYALFEFYRGDIEQAGKTYASLLELARKRSNVQHETWGLVGHARSLIILGKLDEALERLAVARKLLEGRNDQFAEIIAHAYSASAFLHANQLDAAVDAADTAYTLASASSPSLFESLRGFSIPAEVYLDVWARMRNSDPVEVERMRRAVKTLVRTMRKYASRTPLVLPTALRIEGIAECLEGNLRRGASLLRKSAATAARLGLPLDEGIALYELTRHAVLDPRERAASRERAREIFASIGAELYLRKMST